MEKLILFIQNAKNIKIKEKLTNDGFRKTNDSDKNYNYNGYFNNSFLENIKEVSDNEDVKPFIKEVNNITLPITSRLGKIVDSLYILQNLEFYNDLSALKDYFNKVNDKFPQLKDKFLKEFYYFAKVAKGCGKILTMIYFCLLLISATFAGVSMMFYACLKRQGYLQVFMHALWNIIRFFMFSFFFYGAAYGMCYLALRDAVAYVMFIFGEDNLNEASVSYLIPQDEGKDFLRYCLINPESDYKKKIDDTLTEALNDFFKNTQELILINKDYQKNMKKEYSDYSSTNTISVNETTKNTLKSIADTQYTMIKAILSFVDENNNNYICKNIENCDNFAEMAIRDGGLFGSFNCTFLKSDLHMMYKTLYDLSIEARILCALSCCISFFGAIFVYFFLLVLHHYDTELFFDNGKGIFTGFEGIGNTHKKDSNDPSKKKRKLRAEIELSSRNEEYSAYQPDNKNED